MHQSRILRERVAGQSAMAAVVSAQEGARARGLLARVLGISPLTTAARLHYRGALGELLVGDVLENLGPTWDVLHDLPLGDSVLDHLVIGRAGVFTVRAANYGRNDVALDGSGISVAGESRDDVALAAAEAAEVSRLLTGAAGRPVTVRPLLVVVAPLRLTVKSPAAGVRVLSSRELEGVLARFPSTLTGEEVAHISDLADLESTWPAARGPEAPASGAERIDTQLLDTQKLHRDFGTIRTAVNEALVRRILWAAAATIVVYVSVCSIIAAFVSVVVASSS
jgi:hypothetical protein